MTQGKVSMKLLWSVEVPERKLPGVPQMSETGLESGFARAGVRAVRIV
jgi:hypothetical protein